LYRYELTDIDDATQDTWEQVGRNRDVISGQGAAAIDQELNAYVRTSRTSFAYWDLNNPGPNNGLVTFTPTDLDGSFDFGRLDYYGMDYDPVRNQFLLWRGDGKIWSLTSPDILGKSDWFLELLVDDPIFGPSETISDFTRLGILGKWEYIPGYDVFLGINSYESGDVWAYKPGDWQAQLVPVPAAVWLFGSAIFGLVVLGRRRGRETPA